MDDPDDSQTRIDALKAEADKDVQADRKRRFNPHGRQRGSGFWALFFGDLYVGAAIWILTATAIIAAIAVGLGVSLKAALAIAAIAAVAAMAFAVMSN